LISERKNKVLNLVLKDRESHVGQAEIFSAEEETEVILGKY